LADASTDHHQPYPRRGGTEDETNFPVLISLSGHSNINANGSDIRFTASDGVTLLPREIESYAGGTLTAWVKVPTISHIASTSIYMYYGNPAATEPSATSTYGSQNVWTNGYAGVWHTNDNNGTLNLNDSAANGNNGRNNGGVATTTGPIDGAAAFINQNGAAAINTSLDAQPSAIPQTTWSAWVYFTSNNGTNSIMSDDVGGYGRDIESTGDGDGKYHIFYGANNLAPTSAPLDQWHFISLAYASNNVYFYRNGGPIYPWHSSHLSFLQYRFQLRRRRHRSYERPYHRGPCFFCCPVSRLEFNRISEP